MGKSLVEEAIQSTIGQFMIGGLTVAGIGYFADHVKNTAISAIIAAVPIGMPSSVFVKDSKVEDYALKLLYMSTALYISTLSNWVLIKYFKYNKWESVGLSLLVFLVFAIIIAFFVK